jgi:hypothetical protein
MVETTTTAVSHVTAPLPVATRYPHRETYQVLNALLTQNVVAVRDSNAADPVVDLRLAASGNVIVGVGEALELYFHHPGDNTVRLSVEGNEPGAPTTLDIASDTLVARNVATLGEIRCASHVFSVSNNVMREFDDGSSVGYGLRVGDDKRLELYRYHESANQPGATVKVQTFGLLAAEPEPADSDTASFPGPASSNPVAMTGFALGWRVDDANAVVTTARRVAIGRDTAEAKLHVAGDARCDRTLMCRDCVETADASARSAVVDVVAADDAALVDAFRQINIVRYAFANDQGDDASHYGVDAQQIAALLPGAVTDGGHVRLSELLCLTIRVLQGLLA